MLKPALHNASNSERNGYVRLSFGYCRRCGCLRFYPAGEEELLCPACAAYFRWLFGERAPERGRRVPDLAPRGGAA